MAKENRGEELTDRVISQEFMGLDDEKMEQLRRQTRTMISEVRRDLREAPWRSAHAEDTVVVATAEEEGARHGKKKKSKDAKGTNEERDSAGGGGGHEDDASSRDEPT